MDWWVVVISSPVIAFGFIGRFYWAKRTGYLHDTWYHLLASEVIRENDHRLPERIDCFIFEGPYDYPPLLHLALSYLPEELVKRYQWTISPSVELLHGGVLLLASLTLTGRIDVAILALAIYAITPELFRHFIGLTPRVIGSMLVSMIVLSTILAGGGNQRWLFVAMVLAGVLLLTHKMSSQAVLFVMIGLTLFEWDGRYVLVIAGGFVFALVASRGHYLSVLRGHLKIIDFWRRQRAKGNPPNSFARDYGRSEESYGNSLLDRARAIVTGIDPVWVFVSNPWTIILPIPLIVLGGFDALGPTERIIAIWAMVILFVALLTQYVPALKLLGEGYKYFLWGTFPAALILGELAVVLAEPVLYAAMILLGGSSIGFVYFMMRSRVRREHTTDVVEVDEVLARLREGEIRRIMAVPPAGSYPLAYLTRKKILWHDSPLAFDEGEIYYPTPQAPLEEIALQYDIDAIVVDKTRVCVDADDFDEYGPRYESSEHLLLEPAGDATPIERGSVGPNREAEAGGLG